MNGAFLTTVPIQSNLHHKGLQGNLRSLSYSLYSAPASHAMRSTLLTQWMSIAGLSQRISKMRLASLEEMALLYHGHTQKPFKAIADQAILATPRHLSSAKPPGEPYADYDARTGSQRAPSFC